ncbi:hypothetical protein [Rheinheimera sp. MMS21-TC3]|uniref:hypothetical protein n=1 Tax=Rheinheimera sp. MMS21-TC3 TaxID=3072790 RepID=UPI0028C43748|nr:hypothetical protein [Rheinheimera sp. MMS21-TC3]WNO60854.1 hypothetical protein RDV63_07795 [Rheinheimera sp. MMS21-TC3]
MNNLKKQRLECANRNCRRTMLFSELVPVKVEGMVRTLGCPNCSCDSTYDIDAPVTNERVDQCNELIALIASCGRKFFCDKETGYISTLELAKNGRVLFVDYYTRRRVDTHSHAWSGFTSGGTLRNLVTDMRDYIKSGKQIPSYFIGLNRQDGTNIWGYPEDEIQALRLQAAKLPMFISEVVA